MNAGIAALGLAVGLSASLLAAADLPATTPSAPEKAPPTVVAVKELCKGPVDPYEEGRERERFFKAAGPDNELDQKEFAANAGKPDAFVRDFDRWEAILAFDKNRNRTIDWFEADAYRRSIRLRVLAAFDADKDKKLLGAERAKANAALASGRIPGAAPGGRGAFRGGAGGWQADPETLKRYDADGDGQLSSQERAAMYRARAEEYRRQRLEKYDANRDGQVDETERQAEIRDYRARAEEMRRQYELRRYDTNGDGRLDEQEIAAKEAEQNRWREQAAEARRRYELRRYDTNNDGRLDEQEIAAKEAEQARWRDQAERARAEWTRRWDTDGDGQVSQQEQTAMRETLRRRYEQRRREMDADGDGRISADEARGYYEKIRRKYDADGDGKLSDEERRTMYRQEYLGAMGPVRLRTGGQAMMPVQVGQGEYVITGPNGSPVARLRVGRGGVEAGAPARRGGVTRISPGSNVADTTVITSEDGSATVIIRRRPPEREEE